MTHHPSLAASAVALLATLTTAIAGETPAPSGKEPAAPALTTVSTKDWWFDLTAYGWLTDTTGDSGVGRFTAPVKIGIDDVLDNLDFAYMTYLEFGYKKWSLGVDGIYAKMSDDSTFALGPVSGYASLELEQAFITTRLQYRVLESESATVDVFAGFRWNYFDVDLDINANLNHGGLGVGLTEDWFDPIIGARAIVPLGGAWFLQAAGDIGGFGANSDLTWQVLGGFGYRINPLCSLVAGYRAMGIDYDKDGFLMDIVSHGPAIGLKLSF
jgi:hypothetical protein